MGDVVVGIHQPNFMPWLGYFYKIWQSDIFVFLDDVQFPKTGSSTYVNRVSININGESKYVTIPVKRNSGIWNIDETKFIDDKWKRKVIRTLQSNYAKSKYFKEDKDFIFNLINYQTDNLAQFNMNFIVELSKKLGIDTKIVKSSEFNIQTTSTQRLIDLTRTVGGDIYLSGSGGDNYQQHEMYEKESIKLIYNKMPKFEYPQHKGKNFIAGLSIVDAVFNIGFENLQDKLFTKNSITKKELFKDGKQYICGNNK